MSLSTCARARTPPQVLRLSGASLQSSASLTSVRAACLPSTHLLCVAGWEVTTRARFASQNYNGGNHGFDPAYMDMKAIFLGMCPVRYLRCNCSPVC